MRYSKGGGERSGRYVPRAREAREGEGRGERESQDEVAAAGEFRGVSRGGRRTTPMRSPKKKTGNRARSVCGLLLPEQATFAYEEITVLP
jgi:hypothetical protein